jgi:two-component system phosphate regulon sensor histidine kinase PhoR
MDEGIAGWVATHGKPLLVPDVSRDPRFAQRVDKKSQFHTRDILCVPLRVGERMLGVVQVLNRREGQFQPDEVEILEALASMAAVAIENATLYGNLEARAEQLNQELIGANQELGAVLGRLESILFAMEDAVIAFDHEDRVVMMNRVAQALVGARAAQAQGTPVQAVLPGEAFAQAVERVRREGHSERAELVFHHPTERVYATVVAPIRGRSRLYEGAVAVLRDVTELKELDRMKTEFLNTVSHELRTPMTSIRAFSELMAGTDAEPAKVRKWSMIINEETERLGRLIDDLLDVSRLEAGKKMSLHRDDVEIGALAARSLEQWGKVSGKHAFKVKMETRHLAAYVDRDRLLQVIANLVSNAIKYSPEGGEVRLSFKDGRDDPSRLRLEVADQGIGLTDKDRQHLFEKFYRAESSYSQNIRGTGLGLAIIKHIVEQHGGNVGVDSELGKGSTFWLELPAERGPE